MNRERSSNEPTINDALIAFVSTKQRADTIGGHMARINSRVNGVRDREILRHRNPDEVGKIFSREDQDMRVEMIGVHVSIGGNRVI